MELVELVLRVHTALDRAGVSHAFGGALALGFVAAPRGTVDVDVNVFVPPTALAPVVAALKSLDYAHSADEAAAPIAGVRFSHPSEPFPIDVFPSLDPRYSETERRVTFHPFGTEAASLPFLSGEDLCVFKLSFGRPQDWVDLAAIVLARPDLDVDYVEEQLIALRGPTMYPRVARLRTLLRGVGR